MLLTVLVPVPHLLFALRLEKMPVPGTGILVIF